MGLALGLQPVEAGKGPEVTKLMFQQKIQVIKKQVSDYIIYFKIVISPV